MAIFIWLTCLVTGIISIFIYMFANSNTSERIAQWMFILSFVLTVVLAISFAVLSANYEPNPIETVEVKNLYAFQDTSVDSSIGYGNVFFWQFTSDSELKYRYITDGTIGKVIEEANINEFEIIDNEGKNPRIEYHTYTYKYSGINKWLFGEDAKTTVVKVAYIPNGSLVYDFNINLE